MSRRKRKSVRVCMGVCPSAESTYGAPARIRDFKSRDWAVVAAERRDRRWFRKHPGQRRRIRERIHGEFAWMEPELPSSALVESTLLNDGRIVRRPCFSDEPA